MRILNDKLSSADYSGFMNQNLTLDDIKNGFSQADIRFYEKKVALWQELRPLFERYNVFSKSITVRNGVLVEGPEITSLVLAEALEYFYRAFSNFFAQDELIQHGYYTWSGVTNYYVSLFSIHCLLRLQGRAITRIWRPKGKQFYIFPYEFSNHQYVICSNQVEGKSAHDAAWSIYYSVYDGFRYTENLDFEYIFKRRWVGTTEEEIDFRNQINYEPYQGYEEIFDPRLIPEKIRQYMDKRFTSNREIATLSRLTTDPDYKYYARAVLRLIFSYTLLSDVANENKNLNSFIDDRKGALRCFLDQVKPRTEEGMLSHRLQTLMGLEDA